jgi:predicted nucleotidyltransferase
MIPLIEQNREKIIELCKKHGVKRLELFGSAARGDDFDPVQSDVDFLYTIDLEAPDLPDRYFGFHEDMEALLGHKVDLVSIKAMDNPWFWKIANRCRIPLHAA